MASRRVYWAYLLLLCPALSLAQDVLTARVSDDLGHIDVNLCFDGKAPGNLYRHRKADAYSSGIKHQGQVLAHRKTEYSLKISGLPEDACIQWRTSFTDALAAKDYRLILKTGRDLSMNAALWFWKGPMERDLVVDVLLPDGVSISTPWKKLKGTGDKIRFLPDKTSSDWESKIALGYFQVDSIKVPGASIQLASIGKLSGQQKNKLKSWIGESVASVIAVTGNFPQPYPQVLVIAIGRRHEAVVKAQVLRGGGLAAIFYVDETRSLDEFSSDWTATHEFSHMLMPYISTRDRWLSEGLASYYQNVLRARDGRLTDIQAWQQLYEGFQRGRKNTTSDSLAQATRDGRSSTMRVYWSGAALMLMADVQLRENSGGMQSLDTALGALSDCCMENGRTWRARDMFTQLDKLTETDTFKALYREHVHANGFPDLQPILEDLGIDIRAGRVGLRDDAPMVDVRDAIMN